MKYDRTKKLDGLWDRQSDICNYNVSEVWKKVEITEYWNNLHSQYLHEKMFTFLFLAEDNKTWTF